MFFASRRSIVVFITLLTVSSLFLISCCWFLIWKHARDVAQDKVYYELHDISSIDEKRTFVRKITTQAWRCYSEYGWGYKSVKPLTMKPDGEKNTGRSILSAMSTLWVMDLKDEFERGKRWIEKEMDFDSFDISTHYAVEIYIGGLLSSYALSGDIMFLNKAKRIAKTLQPAYQTNTGLSYGSLDVKYKYARGSEVLPSQIAEQQLEYTYLYHLTNDHQVHERIKNIQKVLHKLDYPIEFYMKTLNVENRNWTNQHLLWSQNELFSIDLNLYLQSGEKFIRALETFLNSIESLEKSQLILDEGGHFYTREYYHDRLHHEDHYRMVMSVTACKLGAVFAQGALALQQSPLHHNETLISRLWKIAEGITETCHQASVKTRTGLTPAMMHYYGKSFNDPTTENKFNSHYLNAHLAKSYFVLWRLTRDDKYRQYAWLLVQAIYRHCRTDECGGYSWIYNVNQVPTEMANHQPPEFLSATLKYLYLTFANDNVLPLDQWVFNTAGHPIPISGKNAQYPGEIYTIINAD